MKALKKQLCLLALLLLALTILPPGACALGVDSVSTFYIEQVYANVPELDVFVYAMDSEGQSLSPALVNAAGVELTLGGKKLDTGTITMAGEPVCYLFLLDDSAAVEASAFAAYKRAILQAARSMQEKDQLLLYTTAGGAQCRLRVEAGDTSGLSSLLRHLGQSGEATDLTAALAQAAADVNEDFQSLPPRKAAFVCTSSLALAGDATALAGLVGDAASQLNMALFAFAAAEDSQRLGMLSSATSGRAVAVTPQEIGSAIAAKQAFLANALEIKTAVDTSMGGERVDLLTLSVPSLGSAVQVSTSVYMGHTLTKPQVAAVTVADRNHLELTFNQPVANAASLANYSIRSEDAWSWRVGVTAVALSEDGRTALLTTEDLYRGNYSVQLRKVVSRMTAANECSGDRVAFSVADWPADQRFYLNRFRLPALVLVLALAALAGWGAVQKRRERAAETAAEVEHLLAEPPRADAQLPKRWVTLFVRTRGTIAEKRYYRPSDG